MRSTKKIMQECGAAKSKGGRPPSGNETAKNRTIRLLDSEWESFKRLLGLQWLRDQIAASEEEETDQKPTKE